MADKEPRRRKKRKDFPKKDDIRADDPIFTASKSESRDSDQEVEEEINIPVHHHPSYFAKIVFVLLFSGLIVSMSFIFISLQTAERGSVDIFDAGHSEEHVELTNGELSSDDHHEESSESAESLEDFLPGISNILSLNHGEETKDSDVDTEYSKSENNREKQDFGDSLSQVQIETTSQDYESTIDQGVIEEFVEERVETPSPNTIFEEAEVPLESYIDYSVSEPEDTAEPPEEWSHLREFSSKADEQLESVSDHQNLMKATEKYEPILEEEVSPTTESSVSNDYEALTAENLPDDSDFLYEKSDITNEDDYLIRDSLDDIEKYVEKDFHAEHDHYDTKEEDDIDDEFIFWNF